MTDEPPIAHIVGIVIPHKCSQEWTVYEILSTERAMTDDRDWTDELDARGLLCPLPVLKARKRLRALAPGDVLRLIATDPAAIVDVPHYCAESGHEFLGMTEDGDTAIYLIRRT